MSDNIPTLRTDVKLLVHLRALESEARRQFPCRVGWKGPDDTDSDSLEEAYLRKSKREMAIPDHDYPIRDFA